MARKEKNRPWSPVPTESDRAKPRTLSRRKRLAFRATLVVLPFVVVAIVEITLRLAGYGGYPPVIDDVGVFEGHHWYTTNRAGTDAFFAPGQARTGGMRVTHFITPKPPNTVRIVLLGGSAAQGFPQPLPLTNGAFLQAMLRQIWGETQNVEVLNLGATAVASFPVLHFLQAALEHDPDLVIVMSGNNEFYGAYGVAALPAALRSPTGMRALRWLGSLGITQGLRALTASLRTKGTLPEESLMEIMATAQEFGPTSPARPAAARTLQTHLVEMVRLCEGAGVPIILCTVPTNERGMAPIGVAASSTQFNRARALTELGRHDEALEQYVRSRDLEPMPWRATSAARAAIFAAGAEDAVLCDMESAFRAASPGGAIGWELMDDHVHMSLAGQALFAKTILRAMSGFDGSLHVDLAQLDALPEWREWADLMGRSIYTDYVAAARIRSLLGISFMRQNNQDAYQRFDRLCRSQLDSMSALDRTAVERWRDPELHGASERPLTYVVGVFRYGHGDYESALPLLRSAMRTVPTVSAWRLQLIWYLLQCRRHLLDQATPEDIQLCREAIATGQMLKRFGHADQPDVLRYLGLASNLAGDHAAAIENLEAAMQSFHGRDAWELIGTLADSYVQLGRSPRARDLLQRAMQNPEIADRAEALLSLVPD